MKYHFYVGLYLFMKTNWSFINMMLQAIVLWSNKQGLCGPGSVGPEIDGSESVSILPLGHKPTGPKGIHTLVQNLDKLTNRPCTNSATNRWRQWQFIHTKLYIQNKLILDTKPITGELLSEFWFFHQHENGCIDNSSQIIFNTDRGSQRRFHDDHPSKY